MGLDITAYRKLVPAPDAPRDEHGEPTPWDRYTVLDQESLDYVESHWPGRGAGLTSGVFTFAEDFRFRAGSYGGYNRWRKWLALLAGHVSPDHVWDGQPAIGPFVEIINFSDCEGYIGPVVAKKLAQDFADFQDKAGAIGGEAEKYADWRKAFEMAADGGCVRFH